MNAQYKEILEVVEDKVGSLLIGLNNTNALDRILVIQKIKRDVEKIENAIKDTVDIETEMIAFSNTGIKKHYPNTLKDQT